MGFEFKLPDLGEGSHEAQVLAWKVAPGQEVAAFQPLVEVESAKAAVELTAPVAGRVLETRFVEGAIAQLGDVLVVIDTGGDHQPSREEPREWFGIVGSQPRVSAAPPLPVDDGERKELAAAGDALLATADSEGARLTYLPFFVKACVGALKTVPEANAIVDDAQAAIVLKAEYHIGVATAVPGGLVVPVVMHADRLSLLEIAAELERLVTAARERRSTPAELTGSTFTLTSFGGLPGSPLFATPIVNYPEVAI